MAKRGRKNHQKRIAKPKAVPITDKKRHEWILGQRPGPHKKQRSMSLGVLIKDVLKFAKTNKEARNILNARLVQVDGVVRTDEKFPVGLMDIVSFPKAEKHLQMVVDWKGRIIPREIEKDAAGSKILRVVRKHVAKGGKINLTFHDGRNMAGDNKVHPGDSVIVSLPEAKMSAHIKLESGSRCLIMEGKHAGTIVKLNEILPSMAGRPSEANVSSEEGEFITVAKYLFVVDDSFKV